MDKHKLQLEWYTENGLSKKKKATEEKHKINQLISNIMFFCVQQ